MYVNIYYDLIKKDNILIKKFNLFFKRKEITPNIWVSGTDNLKTKYFVMVVWKILKLTLKQ